MSTQTQAEDLHAVFATTASGDTVRVSDPGDWSASQLAWQKLDELRWAGRLPHVKHFEVRSVTLGRDRPLTGPEVFSHGRYDRAPLDLNYTRPVPEGSRGFKSVEGAARAAWKLFAPTFRDRGHTGRYLESHGRSAEVADQGRGGWFYYPNGTTAAQGLRGLADVVRRRRMVVVGNDGRWYPLDVEAL